MTPSVDIPPFSLNGTGVVPLWYRFGHKNRD
nr:MAG TPA: Hemagglutinin Fusion Peptide G8A mutant virus, hemagglutinin, fusion peptide [Caudoviricetes sp.]